MPKPVALLTALALAVTLTVPPKAYADSSDALAIAATAAGIGLVAGLVIFMIAAEGTDDEDPTGFDMEGKPENPAPALSPLYAHTDETWLDDMTRGIEREVGRCFNADPAALTARPCDPLAIRF